MAHTYYSRLTLIHPQDINKLDPRLGVVIAETATTGKFVVSDITWESQCAPNAQTLTAIHAYGDMKIYEPLGMSMFDYIKAAAFQLGMFNHLDARFLLEIEVLAENLPKSGSPYKYIFPIMFVTSEIKSSVSEKGTEYNIRFIHSGHHGQSDLVQPIKETIKLEASTVGKYLELLQQELENKEFKYAEARQKAGGSKTPGGQNPAKQDDFHDEYHFIIQKEVAAFKFTSKGPADSAVQGSWKNYIPFTTKTFNITARPGTTIVNHINKILQSTDEAANLLLGRDIAKPSDSSGSSASNQAAIAAELGKVYQFFRIETFSVYKSFDYIRQRHAVRHIFFIFLSDQPNMYQYPDEIGLLNQLKYQDKAISKLKYYIQEGLLQKLYYHQYTGLNTDIIKVDINFNQAYSLPSFPVIWADRGETGPGRMNLENYNRRISPFVHKDDLGALRIQMEVIRRQAVRSNDEVKRLINKYASGDPEKFEKFIKNNQDVRDKYNTLQTQINQMNQELKKREEAYATKAKEMGVTNQIKNRADLFNQLNYAEDYDNKSEKNNGRNVFKEIYETYMTVDFPNLNPRMEPDVIAESIDIVKSENEKLMEKIFSVLVAPRDLVEIELEIFADPFWIGKPNVLGQGKKSIDNFEFSPKYEDDLKALIDSKMTELDPDWSTKEPIWSDYGVAPWYKGAPLFYFLSQIPDGQYDRDQGDMLSFNPSDQIVGIYMVHNIVNEFKEGKWTQKLKGIRDITIPSQFIPKGIKGDMDFETFMKYVMDEPRVADQLRDAAASKKANEERKIQAELENLTGNGSGAAGVKLSDTIANRPGLADAYEKQKQILANSPPPKVDNPVTVAEALVESGKSKKEAYEIAKDRYEQQLGDHFKHIEDANKKAYAQAGVTGIRPYSADTMKALAIQRDGHGGLNNWKVGNTTMLGPSELNNPMGVGGNPTIGRYGKFNSFDEGLRAGSDYYNYGAGVTTSPTKAGDRFLLPSTQPTDVTKELKYITTKSAGGKG
jgi:hypothetical protein